MLAAMMTGARFKRNTLFFTDNQTFSFGGVGSGATYALPTDGLLWVSMSGTGGGASNVFGAGGGSGWIYRQSIRIDTTYNLFACQTSLTLTSTPQFIADAEYAPGLFFRAYELQATSGSSASSTNGASGEEFRLTHRETEFDAGSGYTAVGGAGGVGAVGANGTVGSYSIPFLGGSAITVTLNGGGGGGAGVSGGTGFQGGNSSATYAGKPNNGQYGGGGGGFSPGQNFTENSGVVPNANYVRLEWN